MRNRQLVVCATSSDESPMTSNHRVNMDFYMTKLTQDWIIGFIEAEGGFYGKGRNIVFSVSQHLSDWYLLLAIQKYLGAGKLVPTLREDGRLGVELVINNKATILNVIVPFTADNVSSSKKLDQFNAWIKEHYDLPPTKSNPVISKEWVSGFVDGDGSFFFRIAKSSSYKCGYSVRAVFDITQVISEINLLNSIGASFFNNARVVSQKDTAAHMVVSNFSANLNYVEPFFSENHLLTRKCVDFLIWQEALRMIKSKQHVTTLGVSMIKDLRGLQYIHRKQIHPIIIDEVIKIRPDWKGKICL